MRKQKVYDVVVVGGGVAGVSAALSAAREGLSVCLVEKDSLLGGLATKGLINWFEPLCDGKGTQVIYSQADEFFNLAIKYGYSTYDADFKDNGKRKCSLFDHSLFALSLNRLMAEYKIKVEYETVALGTVLKDEVVSAIEVYNVEGKKKIYGKSFIDASGNAVLFRMAGVDVRIGNNYLTYVTSTYENGTKRPLMQTNGASLDGLNHPEGMKLFNGLSQEDIDEYLKLAQELTLSNYETGKRNYVGALPSMPQFRKIASICGEKTLTTDDMSKPQEDSVGIVGYFMKAGEYFEIPLGTFYSAKVKNLFAAGRILSSEGEGWEAIRVIPVGILTGEVSGILAMYAIKDGQLSYDKIAEKLKKRGILLHH